MVFAVQSDSIRIIGLLFAINSNDYNDGVNNYVASVVINVNHYS